VEIFESNSMHVSFGSRVKCLYCWCLWVMTWKMQVGLKLYSLGYMRC